MGAGAGVVVAGVVVCASLVIVGALGTGVVVTEIDHEAVKPGRLPELSE